jgi:hypothetical protein
MLKRNDYVLILTIVALFIFGLNTLNVSPLSVCGVLAPEQSFRIVSDDAN